MPLWINPFMSAIIFILCYPILKTLNPLKSIKIPITIKLSIRSRINFFNWLTKKGLNLVRDLWFWMLHWEMWHKNMRMICWGEITLVTILLKGQVQFRGQEMQVFFKKCHKISRWIQEYKKPITDCADQIFIYEIWCELTGKDWVWE